MNVPFVTGDKDLDAKFVAQAKAAGLENLKGIGPLAYARQHL